MNPARATNLATVAAPPQALPGCAHAAPRHPGRADHAHRLRGRDGRDGRHGDRRHRGWVCAAAVHSVMVARSDPGMREALTRRRDHRARRHADRVGGQRPGRGPAQPRIRPRADAPSPRPLGRARPPRVALRRPRPGRARAARPHPAPEAPRHQDRGRLLARPSGRCPTRRTPPWPSRSTTPAPTWCGWASACPSRRSGWCACASAWTPGAVRRGRRLRLPRRPRVPGAALDAGARAGVDLPHRAGAQAPAAALPGDQPELHAQLRAPVDARARRVAVPARDRSRRSRLRRVPESAAVPAGRAGDRADRLLAGHGRRRLRRPPPRALDLSGRREPRGRPAAG